MARILIADDEADLRDAAAEAVRRAGHEAAGAADGWAALDWLDAEPFDVLLTDLKMPGMTGIELMAQAKRRRPGLRVIVMTAQASVPTAVSAIRQGACDYLEKPFDLDELRAAVGRAARPEPGPAVPDVRPVIGESPTIREVRRRIAAVADAEAAVLIRGETGTGKEVVAHAVHAAGRGRAGGPLVTVDCAALDAARLDAELFGDAGAFARAAHGTLLLDEVGELDLPLQCKLLRALEGGAGTVRVVATSHRDLESAVAGGAVRGDLFFRLNVLPIELPPLRERAGDVADFAAHFLGQIARRCGTPHRAVEAEAMELLRRHAWPGNVRELQNILERASVLEAEADVVRAVTLGPWLSPPRPAASSSSAVDGALDLEAFVDQPLADIERHVILATLRRMNGHRARTAAALGIGVRTLGMKLKKWRDEGQLAAA